MNIYTLLYTSLDGHIETFIYEHVLYSYMVYLTDKEKARWRWHRLVLSTIGERYNSNRPPVHVYERLFKTYCRNDNKRFVEDGIFNNVTVIKYNKMYLANKEQFDDAYKAIVEHGLEYID